MAGLLLYVGLLVRLLHERRLWRHFDPRKVILPFRAVFEFSFPLITGELALLSMKVGGVMVLALFHPVTEIASYRAVFGIARLNTAVTTSFATLFLPISPGCTPAAASTSCARATGTRRPSSP